MDLKQKLESKGINNIEASKNYIKTEFSTIEVKEDKEGILTLSIQLKELGDTQIESILESLKTYLH